MGIGIHTVPFDRLIWVVRCAFPAPTCYGGDKGGDQHKIRRVLANEADMAVIADAISDIDIQFDLATKQHFAAIEAAKLDRSAALEALVTRIKRGVGSP